MGDPDEGLLTLLEPRWAFSESFLTLLRPQLFQKSLISNLEAHLEDPTFGVLRVPKTLLMIVSEH